MAKRMVVYLPSYCKPNRSISLDGKSQGTDCRIVTGMGEMYDKTWKTAEYSTKNRNLS